MRSRPIVAIDGPAGAGKSSVAQEVARRLGFLYVDTGAMYRAVAWAALQEGISPEAEEALASLARRLTLRWEASPQGPRIWVDDEEVTEAIRSPQVASIVSQVASHPLVREVLWEEQRRLAAQGGVVMEGRDVQTVVAPDAEVKIFLTASLEERARRRLRELEQRGLPASWEEVLENVRQRDERDSQRAVAPLQPAPDALILPTDGLSLEEVVERVLEVVRERTGWGAKEG